METEKYIITAGNKYFANSMRTFKLTDNIDLAIHFRNKEDAESHFDVPVLKNKNPKIKKLLIKYEIIDFE